MSITVQSATDRAYERLLGLGVPTNPARIAGMVGQALELMGKRVAAGDGHEGLMKDFTATPSSGVVDLTALTNILFDIKKSTVRVTSTNLKITSLDALDTLERGGLPTDQVFYAQDGPYLRFRDTNGSTTAYATGVTIKSSFVPTITEVSATVYEEALVSTLVELTHSPDAKPEEVAIGRA